MSPVIPANAASLAAAATSVAEQATKAPLHDPLMQGLTWFIGIVVAILGLAKPIMGLVRQYRVDRTDGARDTADQATFERQTKQIDKLTADVERLVSERDQWFREATELRSRVEKLEIYEKTLIEMNRKLEQKDQVITELRTAIKERDGRIMSLMDELMRTNQRLYDLEVRIARDEKQGALTPPPVTTP